MRGLGVGGESGRKEGRGGGGWIEFEFGLKCKMRSTPCNLVVAEAEACERGHALKPLDRRRACVKCYNIAANKEQYNVRMLHRRMTGAT